MLQEERYQVILRELSAHGAVKVAELSILLGASQSTIRRDIAELDRTGRLKKVFGGAVETERHIKTVEEDMKTKTLVRVTEKETVARYAAALIEDNDFIFIDAGTTTERMIDFVDNHTATYVTNGITHAQKLAGRGFKVHLTGGQLKPVTLSIVGGETISFLRRYNFTKSFMGVNGIDIQRGFTTPDVEESMVKEEVLRRTSAAYMLADSSKFGCVSAATFGNLEDGCIITDRLSDQIYKKYTAVREVLKS